MVNPSENEKPDEAADKAAADDSTQQSDPTRSDATEPGKTPTPDEVQPTPAKDVTPTASLDETPQSEEPAKEAAEEPVAEAAEEPAAEATKEPAGETAAPEEESVDEPLEKSVEEPAAEASAPASESETPAEAAETPAEKTEPAEPAEKAAAEAPEKAAEATEKPAEATEKAAAPAEKAAAAPAGRRPAQSRAGGGDRRGQQRGRRDNQRDSSESDGPELMEKVVHINRCAKVVKGGRRFSFSALVVAGDQNGQVGFGFGKAKEVAEAIRKASDSAKKSLVRVPINGTTIPHDVFGEFGGGKVLLRPASEGTGIVAGGGVRAVLEVAGVKDILAKSMGSSNHGNVVKSTLHALAQLRMRDEVFKRRGKTKVEKAI